MDAIRFGLHVRALRRRRRWTQSDLAARAGCSRSAIARIERGDAARSTIDHLEGVLRPLDARMAVRILWHGEELDRLVDADHAQLVGEVTRRLAALGWHVSVEVTFQIYGERGSIDVLGIHPAGSSVLVLEVKSVVPDLQATLATLDRKVRLTPQILRQRGSPGTAIGASRLLVLPANSTTYRRTAALTALSTALPARTREVRRWLANPTGTIDGIWFVPSVTTAGARHRIRRPQAVR